MTATDEALQAAIIDQLNAEIAIAGLSMKAIAEKIGRPYDSTRNYLRKERAMPALIFLELSSALSLMPEEIISRARQRIY